MDEHSQTWFVSFVNVEDTKETTAPGTHGDGQSRGTTLEVFTQSLLTKEHSEAT